jgi:hypothetical protein
MWDQNEYPTKAKCGELLGDEECQNERAKVYYKCNGCGCVTIKNQGNNYSKEQAPCTHKGKRLFSRPSIPPKSPPPGAESEASSSGGTTPFKMIGHHKYFDFI